MGGTRTPSILPALSESWWAFALRGLAAVPFGLAALLLPLDTPAAVGRLFGAYATLEGALVLLTGVRRTRRNGLFLGEGAFDVAAGLASLA